VSGHILIIGAGCSVSVRAIKLREAGFSDFVFRKGEIVAARGARTRIRAALCDVRRRSIRSRSRRTPEWTQAFGSKPEIQRYLEKTAKDSESCVRSVRNGGGEGAVAREKRSVGMSKRTTVCSSRRFS